MVPVFERCDEDAPGLGMENGYIIYSIYTRTVKYNPLFYNFLKAQGFCLTPGASPKRERERFTKKGVWGRKASITPLSSLFHSFVHHLLMIGK
jgi:hypothetical protein